MASLSEKIEIFKRGDHQFDEQISISSCKSISVRSTVSLEGILFEIGIGLNSPKIPRGTPAFVGAYSYMNDGGYIRGNVFIGRFSSIGRRVTIGAGGHYMTGVSTHPLLSGGKTRNTYSEEEMIYLKICQENPTNGVTMIGCDVWIGDGVIVMPGITIGHGAVIGANSVVTKDVPPYSIVAGSPAREIRNRFPQDIANKLIMTQWWEYSLEQLKSLPLGNILKFIDSIDKYKLDRNNFLSYRCNE